MTPAQEITADALVGSCTKSPGPLPVAEESGDGGAESGEVPRVVDEDSACTVVDLVGDAADAGGDDRASLPHRLGDGQPEALGEALLHHHVGAGLQCVDDPGVLVRVAHRQRCEVNALAPR